MKTKKRKAVWIELSKENHERLEMLAKKNGLKWEQVVNMILVCELDVVEYVASKRAKLLKKLKIEPTAERLYHHIL